MTSDTTPSCPPVVGRIDVERLGGIAGYGLPGGRLRSRGHLMTKNLSADDLHKVCQLFCQPVTPPSLARDAFRYQLTAHSNCGPQSVVIAETAVPEVVRNCVRDEFVPP